MAMTDPIADLLTRIRNGLMAKHVIVEIPHSNVKLELVRVLKEEGYIRNFKVVSREPRDAIKVLLKYGAAGAPVISGLERVSKPGRRIYAGKKEIPSVYGGLGIAIISTSRGVMTGHSAKETGVGGEVLCNVW